VKKNFKYYIPVRKEHTLDYELELTSLSFYDVDVPKAMKEIKDYVEVKGVKDIYKITIKIEKLPRGRAKRKEKT
jgi:hypothetical protein